MGQWKDVAIKLSNPKTFTCVRCGIKEEALPTGTTDVLGGTHFVYHTPKGWWSITNRYEMLLFCRDEAVTIVGGDVQERGRGGQDGL